MSSQEPIERKIFLLRGQKVMLSHDLAELYRVEPRVLTQAVKRNRDRFPKDFMFQLSWEESTYLELQFVILKRGRNIKYRPYAFTEPPRKRIGFVKERRSCYASQN